MFGKCFWEILPRAYVILEKFVSYYTNACYWWKVFSDAVVGWCWSVTLHSQRNLGHCTWKLVKVNCSVRQNLFEWKSFKFPVKRTNWHYNPNWWWPTVLCCGGSIWEGVVTKSCAPVGKTMLSAARATSEMQCGLSRDEIDWIWTMKTSCWHQLY